MDLFEQYEKLPEPAIKVIEHYSTKESTYENCRNLENDLRYLGYTFNYGLDAIPYNLRKI